MIEYLEIRDKSTRQMIGVIDTASSIIWETEYYGAGSFEVFVKLEENTRQLLQIGNYITRQDERNAAIIESLEYTDSVENGVMIIARGRMLKSILDRRLAFYLNGHTLKPVRMSGNLANAIFGVIKSQAGVNAQTARKMGVVTGSKGGITKIIRSAQGESSSRQSSYKNLLTFTDGVLEEFECGALMRIDRETLEMTYDLFEGVDRSISNTGGNDPVIFSQDFDNLLSVDYSTDTTYFKNWALIGGEGEGLNRFYSTYSPSTPTGLDRREVFVDAWSYPKKYEEDGEEHEYTDEVYDEMIVGQAQTDMKEYVTTEVFVGEINLTESPYQYNVDFGLGDIVTVQDNMLGLVKDVRILRATEVQDENGYVINFEYGTGGN